MSRKKASPSVCGLIEAQKWYVSASGGRKEGDQARMENDIISQYFLLDITCDGKMPKVPNRIR